MDKAGRQGGDPGAASRGTAAYSLAPADFVDPFKARAEKELRRKEEARRLKRAIPAFDPFAANAPAPDPFRKETQKAAARRREEPAAAEVKAEPAEVAATPAAAAKSTARDARPIERSARQRRARKPVASAAPEAPAGETDEPPAMPAAVLAAFAASRSGASVDKLASIGAVAGRIATGGEAEAPVLSAAEVLERARAEAPSRDPEKLEKLKPVPPAPPKPTPANTDAPPTAKLRESGYYETRPPRDTGKRAASLSERGSDSILDDVVVWLLIAVLMLLIGWAVFTNTRPVAKPSAPEPMAKPQSVAAAPEADPFPEGPVDLTPQSVLAAEPQAAFVAPVAETLAPAPTLAPLPVAGSCPSGRVVRALFCTRSTFLTAEGRMQLERDIEQWRDCSGERSFIVRGYADTRGSSELNRSLAEGRAASVAAVLKLAGLKSASPEGVGELADLPDGVNCPNQRRVDVYLGDEAPPVSRACAPPEEMAALVCP